MAKGDSNQEFLQPNRPRVDRDSLGIVRKCLKIVLSVTLGDAKSTQNLKENGKTNLAVSNGQPELIRYLWLIKARHSIMALAAASCRGYL